MRTHRANRPNAAFLCVHVVKCVRHLEGHISKPSLQSTDQCQPCQRQTWLTLPQCHGWVKGLISARLKVSAVHTGCPQWPPHAPPRAPIPRSLCLCLCLSSPRVLARPWEEPGTHRHWLVVSNASTNSRFHGSLGGGRVRALRPAGASWVPTPTPRDLIVPLVAPPQAATWEGSHFIMTPWHQNVTSNSKVQRQCARQMSPQWTGCHREARGPALLERRCRGRATVTHRPPSLAVFLCPFPTPPLPL